MARNHISFAMSCWWLFAIATGRPIEAFGTMAAAIGGLLPDLDHPKSALGRRIPLVSTPISRIFGHRGITHSLLAVVVMLLGLLTMTLQYQWSFVGWLVPPILVGYLSHILGDSFTPSGVPIFWPKPKTYSFNLFKTWSWQETACMGAFTIAVILLGDITGQVWHHFLTQFQSSLPMH